MLIPSEVHSEVEEGRERHPGTPPLEHVPWVDLTFVREGSEYWTYIGVKADIGGFSDEHLGECAVTACAKHRELTVILDEREAVTQAHDRDVRTHDTMWIAIHAYKNFFDRDRSKAAALVDDLLATGMRLPVSSGESLFQWGYENGLLP